jgi:hypothetical protein
MVPPEADLVLSGLPVHSVPAILPSVIAPAAAA